MEQDNVSPHSRAVRWHPSRDGQATDADDLGEQLPEELAQVAALIRPLPESVQPAPEFVERTRDRLRNLPGAAPSSDSHAA